MSNTIPFSFVAIKHKRFGYRASSDDFYYFYSQKTITIRIPRALAQQCSMKHGQRYNVLYDVHAMLGMIVSAQSPNGALEVHGWQFTVPTSSNKEKFNSGTIRFTPDTEEWKIFFPEKGITRYTPEYINVTNEGLVFSLGSSKVRK